MFALNGSLCSNPFSPGPHNIYLRGLFVGGKVRLQIKIHNPFVVIHDPATGSKCGAPHHILTGSISGPVVKTEKRKFVRQEMVDVSELRHRRRCFCFITDLFDIFIYPFNEIPCPASIRKNKNRRPLHGIINHRCFYTSAHIQELHATVIRRHQCAFSSSQRHYKIAFRIFSVNAERARYANGYLRHTNKVLNIAFECVGVDGIVAHMIHRRAGCRSEICLTGFDDFCLIVVMGISWDPLRFGTDV